MTFDRYYDIDLSVALNMLHKLELQDGDLGAAYWEQISLLLHDAAAFRQRALVAEGMLRRERQRATAEPISKDDQWRQGLISLKERQRIAREFPRDVARMQTVLMGARAEYEVDDMILAWNAYSSLQQLVWKELPKDDRDLLQILLLTLGLMALKSKIEN